MASNELVLLDQVLAQRQADRPVQLPEDDAFEVFACEQVVRSRDLSNDEVVGGIVGGGNDGGLDGVFVFLNDVLLGDDSDLFEDSFQPANVPTSSRLVLVLVQAKTETSFSETAIVKVIDSTSRLLSLSEAEQDLLQLYSTAVVSKSGLFREALKRLAVRHPQVHIEFFYVSRGDTGNVNSKVIIQCNNLEKALASVVSGATAKATMMGATELWRQVSTAPSYTTQLAYQENATSGSSHVALVNLGDYYRFLVDENGLMRRHIFDLNVRDYQGSVEVNREIAATLEDQSSPEFWWLNNGVTVVCSKASAVGKTYVMDNVQIVNGLQSSYTICNVLQDAPEDHPSFAKSVLVRILVTGDDPKVRDAVIRATNRQTSVPAASLRATDDIQRDIEAYFLESGLYYDRRKNFYRNTGKSPERIVSIPLLAQEAMAMGLGRPDDSRARPSSLLKRDDDYKRVFDSSVSLAVYLWLARTQKRVDAFLQSDSADADAQIRLNLRFHLSMLAAACLTGARVYSLKQLTKAAEVDAQLNSDQYGLIWQALQSAFFDEVERSGGSEDKVSKGPAFATYLRDVLLPQLLPIGVDPAIGL